MSSRGATRRGIWRTGRALRRVSRFLVAALLGMTSVAALLGMTTEVARAQRPSVSTGRVVGEMAAGMLGAPVGFAVGYTIGSGFKPHGSSNTGVAVGLTGALLGPAVAVHAAAGPTHGNFAATVGGTALGYAATYVAFPAARKLPFEKLKTLTSFATLLLPAVGATIAYNATRR